MTLLDRYTLTNSLFLLAFLMGISIISMVSCKEDKSSTTSSLKAADLLGNPKYQAISYGGYRMNSRDQQPSIANIKEDLRILSALNIKVIRTYNVHLPHAANVLKAITELKIENESFEMYVMLGAWIDCKNAWTDQTPIHSEESDRNAIEVNRAIELAKQYPDIVKIITVGNEAMVKWATAYYVEPSIILKWVKHIQDIKKDGQIDQNLWVTSSDNFASWGGGSSDYHVPDLKELLKAVDYVSMHTYPMHDTHYNPSFWGITETDQTLTKTQQVKIAMDASIAYAQSQYNSVKGFLDSLNIQKDIHIGETGWASSSDGFYGLNGSKACDEYKQALYYEGIREWTNEASISCFFFEAFDEPWKDAANPLGSENHFGLFTKSGEAKYVLWDQVEKGIFKGISRGSTAIQKSYNGQLDSLLEKVEVPLIFDNNE